MNVDRQVVITGIGVVSPAGIGRQDFWRFLINAKDGIERIKTFDTSLYRTHIGGEVKSFKPNKYIRKISIPHCRSSQLSVAAARLAIEDSGLNEHSLLGMKDRVGVISGSTTADPDFGRTCLTLWAKHGYKNAMGSLTKKLSKTLNWFTVGMANSIANEFGIGGISLSIPTACAAGNYCIGYAFDLLKSNKLDLVIAGGSDPMNQLVFGGFNRLFALDPECCRPFDLHRKGLVVSEGAGMLVLENLAHARKRKANIYAEVLGYGLGCDAYHATGMHPEGLGALNAVRMALDKADISVSEIDYVNAHGTGTLMNDRIETRIIKKIFGKRAKKVPVSSIKSMIGHTMGAASAIEAAACALVVKKDIIPPTINYRTPDPECDLDFVPNVARQQTVKVALSNSFGFGGNIGVLLVAKFNG